MRAALDAHLVDGTPQYSNYSLRLDDPAEGGATPLKTLYTGSRTLVATRSKRRAIDALLRHLSAWALRGRPGLLEVEAAAAVGHGQALLLPPALARRSPRLERPLARAGWTLLDAPTVHLDPSTCELVVREPALTVDWQPLAPLRPDGERPAGEGREIPPGNYPVAWWTFATTWDERVFSPGETAMVAVSLARRPPGMAGEELLETVAGVLDGARTITVRGGIAQMTDEVLAAIA